MLNKAPNQFAGFTLIEVLISMAIGVTVLIGVTSAVGGHVKSNADNLKMTRLNKDLRSIMGLMTRDIRRAGYWSQAAVDLTDGATDLNRNPVIGIQIADVDGDSPADDFDCILYAYDAANNGDIDGDGDTDANDLVTDLDFDLDIDATDRALYPIAASNAFGFKLRNGAVQSRNAAANCTDTANWEDLNNTNTTEMTALSFNHITTSVVANGVAIRQILITLTGRIPSDTSVTRALTETVRVRNDLYTP